MTQEDTPNYMQPQTILQLAESCPGLTVTVKLSEMMEANAELMRRFWTIARQEAQRPPEERLISRKEAMRMLNVCSTTLWAWKNNGTLTPVEVGGRDRYRLSDIYSIINPGRGHV